MEMFRKQIAGHKALRLKADAGNAWKADRNLKEIRQFLAFGLKDPDAFFVHGRPEEDWQVHKKWIKTVINKHTS